MTSSRHLGQYKGNFDIMDEVLIANLSPTKAPVTRMCFQIVPFSYPCAFKSFHFHIFAFSNRSNLVCVFKCLRFHNRLHRFRVKRR